MAQSPQTAAPKKRRWLKIVGAALALYLLFLAVGGLAVRLLLPAERVREAVLVALERSLDRQVAVGDVELHLLKGITLKDVRITTPAGAESTAFPLRTATIERFVLGYRLQSLFKRRLEITEITLVKPQVDLLLLPRPASAPAGAAAEHPADTSRAGASLPIEFALHRLEIHHLACMVEIATDTSHLQFGLDGLSFFASKLRLPRPWQGAEGSIVVTCADAPAFFRQSVVGVPSALQVSGRLDFNLSAEVHTLSDLRASLVMATEQLRVLLPGGESTHPGFLPRGELPRVELRTSLQGDIPRGDFFLDRLSLALAGQPLLLCRGGVSNLGDRPRVNLEVLEGEISLTKLLNRLRSAFAQSALAARLPAQLSGTLSLAGTRIEGSLPSPDSTMHLNTVAVVDLRDVSLLLPEVAELARLSFHAKATANFDSSGVREGEIAATMTFDRAGYMAEPTPVTAAGGKLELAASAQEGLRALNGDVSIEVASALGSQLLGEVHLSTGPSSSRWRGTVDLHVHQLPLAPLTAGQVSGSVSTSLAARIRGLDDIGLQLTVNADSMGLQVQGHKEPLPSLEMTSVGKLRADTKFTAFAVDSLLIHFADVLSAQLTGSLRVKEQRFVVNLKDLTLYHRALPELLPAQLLEQVGEIALAGATHVRASASGRLVPGRPEFRMQGKLSSRIDADLPLLGLSLSAGQVGAEVNATPSSGNAVIDVGVDALAFTQLPLAPLTAANGHFEVETPELRRVVLSRGVVSLPSLGSKVELTGSMTPEATGPLVSATVAFDLQATDTVQVTETVKLLGQARAAAHVRMQNSTAAVKGELAVPELTVYLPAHSSLKGIRAWLPFSQAFDLGQMRLLAPPAEQYAYSGPGALYPELFTSHFVAALPEQGWLTIDRLSFAGYSASNFRMRLFVGGGKVIVPTLLVDVYGGNFGGSIAVEARSLDLAQIRYKVDGHLSGLNSALLAARRGQPLEKGVINANFSFSGTGLDVRKGIEVEGFFRITEIGPRVADNLLQSLDPQGVDAGIRSARFFINHGFKPRLISFDLRHGHLYPSITLSQPWYFPVRIAGSGQQGGKVELARIPVAFFLQMFKQETVPAY